MVFRLELNAGNKNQLCTLKKDDQPVMKTEKALQIIYTEESLLQRRDTCRFAF